MTSGLLTSCRKKDKMYLKYKKTQTPANRSRCIQFRNIFKKVKIQAKKLYYENEFLKYNHDIRKTWRIIKKITQWEKCDETIGSLRINNVIKDDPKELIAHVLNGYFAGIGQSLANRITFGHGNPEDYMTTSVQGSFAIIPTSPREIIDLAHDTKNSRSSGPDGIDPLVGKRTIDHTAGIISDIINSSIETCKIPSDMKKAKITPIFKQGDREDLHLWHKRYSSSMV